METTKTHADDAAGGEASPATADQRMAGMSTAQDRPTFVSSTPGHRFATFADVPSILVSGKPSTKTPLISVVIPTFRRPDLLGEAVRSALAQTGFDDYDIIVVDNDANAGSDSPTATLMASFTGPKVSYYRNARNIGMEGNLNRTIEIGRGRYVCHLHDDDWLSPHYLARLTCRLPADAEFISGEVAIGTEAYRRDFPWDRHAGVPHVRRLSKLDAIHAITSMAPAIISRQALIDLGGYDADAFPVLDYVLFTAIVGRGRAYKVPEVLSYYRTTDSVTFTGNVLDRQIRGSLKIKRTAMVEVPWLSGYLYYVESARRQFERVHLMGKEAAPYLAGRADRIADWLARRHAAGRLFGTAMSGVRGLSSLTKRV